MKADIYQRITDQIITAAGRAQAAADYLIELSKHDGDTPNEVTTFAPLAQVA